MEYIILFIAIIGILAILVLFIIIEQEQRLNFLENEIDRLKEE